MKKVQFTETILRDANQSLVATRLGYDQFEPILETIDKAGFYSVECWGGATFDVCLRFLNEDPWERLRKIRAKMPNTKLQMLLRGQNILGYKHYSDDVVRRFVRAAVRNGIDIIRIFDALNDLDNLRVAVEETVKSGAMASGAISYSRRWVSAPSASRTWPASSRRSPPMTLSPRSRTRWICPSWSTPTAPRVWPS